MTRKQKKVNVSTLIIVIMAIFMISVVFCTVYKSYIDHKYVEYMRNEYSMYQKHFKKLTYPVFVMTKISCKKHGVAVPEMLALIQNESNFSQFAISCKGAMGYTQLMPDKISRYKMTDPFDIRENIDVGVQFYKYCKKRAHGNIQLAFMKYNGGPNRVKFAPNGESEIYGKRCIADVRKMRGIIVAMM